MGAACVLCGHPSEDPHHVTGWGWKGTQLDDDYRLPLCHDDHELVHDDLRQAGIDKPLQGKTVIEEVARRLERSAALLGRLGEAVPAVSSVLYLARAMRFWAEQLHKVVQLLDNWNPSWRTVVGRD